MIIGITASGFKYEIDEKTFDDMEMLDMIVSVEENPLVLGKIIEKMLGEDGKKRLYDNLREEDGRVPIGKVNDALIEIMNGSGDEGKN